MGVRETAANRCEGAAVRCRSWAEVGLAGTSQAERLRRCGLGCARAQDHCSYSRTVPTLNRKLKNKIVCLCPAGTHGKSPVAPVIKAEGLKFRPGCD